MISLRGGGVNAVFFEEVLTADGVVEEGETVVGTTADTFDVAGTSFGFSIEESEKEK